LAFALAVALAFGFQSRYVPGSGACACIFNAVYSVLEPKPPGWEHYYCMVVRRSNATRCLSFLNNRYSGAYGMIMMRTPDGPALLNIYNICIYIYNMYQIALRKRGKKRKPQRKKQQKQIPSRDCIAGLKEAM